VDIHGLKAAKLAASAARKVAGEQPTLCSCNAGDVKREVPFRSLLRAIAHLPRHDTGGSKVSPAPTRLEARTHDFSLSRRDANGSGHVSEQKLAIGL